MKKYIYIIINLLLIVFSIISYVLLIKQCINMNYKYIWLLHISILCIYISINILFTSKFFKYNIKDIINNRTITIVLTFMFTSFGIIYSSNRLCDYFNNIVFTINNSNHGLDFKVKDELIFKIKLKIINIKIYLIKIILLMYI